MIFFRTVFAQKILPSIKSAIVFEEPDPPESLELGAEAKNVQEPDLPKVALLLPKVAIIIDDMGYHESIDKELLALPIELTYSFLPFAPHTKTLERQAYRSGKTVLLHLPLQPKGNEWDPGPGALTLEDLPEVQKIKLEKCLKEVPHAVGVNNHMGSLYTENQVAMTRLIQEIGDRTLFFIDSYTSSGSVGLPVAQGLDVKSARRHVFLDNVLDQKKI
ncbi:MAG: divergent polysaccharide deacetylase family protein [Desulfobulbaceae bacterium]|nr:divergent polysaccharide deacetylase family protein [Desulfobulbaceae bacterium]